MNSDATNTLTTFSALRWSFANTLASRFGTFAIGVALARVLGPEEFGSYAVAYLALVAVLSFNELGVSLAVVRWPADPRAIAPTVASLSLLSSAAVAVGAWLAAPAFAAAMGDPGSAGLVRLMSLCVIINGAVATPAALLQRNFRQDLRLLADQVNVWLGALVSLALVLAGLGAIALVLGRVLASLVSAVMLVRMSPLPYRLGWNSALVRPLLRFGLPLAGASALTFLAGYVDQILVGSLLGPTLLGYYVLAFNLASWPVTVLSQPVRAVAPALFSRLQHDGEGMRTSFRAVLGPLTGVALPVCATLAAASESVVTMVYGEAWVPAAAALQWLAVLAILKILFELAYDYLVVLGRSGSLLSVQAIWLILLVPGVAFAATVGGIAGVALAQVLVGAAVILPLYVALLTQAGFEAMLLPRRLALPLVAGLAVAALVRFADEASASTAAGVVMAAGIGAGAAALLLVARRSDLAAIRLRPPAPARLDP